MKTILRRLVPAALLALTLASGAGAQEQPPGPRLDPAQPLPYRSAFDGYQPHADPVAAPWREANDLVRRLGGHAGHLRGAAGTPRPVPAAAATPGAASGPQAPAPGARP